MNNLKNSIAAAISIYLVISAIDAFMGSFEINHFYFSFLIIATLLVPSTYLLVKKNSEINKIFLEREKLKIKNKNSYPSTMCINDISHGKYDSKWSFWREYLSNFFIVLLLLGTVGVILLYGLSFNIHKVIVPFSDYKRVKVEPINVQCPHRTATIQVCNLLAKTENGKHLALKVPTYTAQRFINGNKYLIESKHSFIGQSISRYKEL